MNEDAGDWQIAGITYAAPSAVKSSALRWNRHRNYMSDRRCLDGVAPHRRGSIEHVDVGEVDPAVAIDVGSDESRRIRAGDKSYWWCELAVTRASQNVDSVIQGRGCSDIERSIAIEIGDGQVAWLDRGTHDLRWQECAVASAAKNDDFVEK